MDNKQTGNIYLITYGDAVYCIVNSPRKFTAEQLRTWRLEALKRSATFARAQVQKLATVLDNPAVTSTNYYVAEREGETSLTFEQWEQMKRQAGIEENPGDWLERVLKEQGCEILEYWEFNLDD